MKSEIDLEHKEIKPNHIENLRELEIRDADKHKAKAIKYTDGVESTEESV